MKPIEDYYYIVNYLAMKRQTKNITVDELKGAGFLALVESYPKAKNITYLYYRISGAMYSHMRFILGSGINFCGYMNPTTDYHNDEESYDIYEFAKFHLTSEEFSLLAKYAYRSNRGIKKDGRPNWKHVVILKKARRKLRLLFKQSS